jgi:hypothetical protein
MMPDPFDTDSPHLRQDQVSLDDQSGVMALDVRMAERRKGQIDGPGDQGPGGAVITQTRTRTKRPHLYRVLLLE